MDMNRIYMTGPDDDKGDDTPERGVATKVRPKTKKPSMYRVILMNDDYTCLLYTSPSPRDQRGSRMPSSA